MTTVQQAKTPDSIALQRYESTFGKVYRKVFNDRPELSVRVRVLFAAATIWASFSLFIIGVSPIVPLATIPVTIFGHWVALKATRRRMSWISLVIGGAIITAGVSMRFELVEALQGNRIPVANFLLIASAAAVFDARTRSGLYTQLVFSGLIMFFAAEKAFGTEFAALLAGYMTIVVIILATTQYLDLTTGASVKRLSNRFTTTAYWASAGLAVVIASLAAFMILPWDTSQTPQTARTAFLPVTGEDSTLPDVDLKTAQDLLEGKAGANGQSQVNPDLFAEHDLADGGPTTEGINGQASEVEPDFFGIPLTGELGGGESVAFVRSSVASYWRGRVYDTFDPSADNGLGLWFSSVNDSRKFHSILSGSADVTERGRYLQTYFVQEDLGTNLLTGYEPIAAAVPRDRRGAIDLTPGATYQVVSKQPETDPDILRRDRGEWIRREYGNLPQGFNELHTLASRLTAGAKTDFDKASAIASYLHKLEYDTEAESPLVSSTDMRRFVIGELPGSAIDFATAMTLMSRSVGLQSRVATGYLPGKYNTYSGASKVTPADAHAWSEIHFSSAGWIPFDASTRSDLPVPAEIEQAPPSGLSSLLDRRLGDNLAAAAGKTPGAVLKGFEFAMKHGFTWGLFLLAGAGFGALLVWYLFFYSKTKSEKPAEFNYDKVDGKDRKAIIAAFVSLEKNLAKNGFRRRMENESFRAYATEARPYVGDHARKLTWLADAASRAAFSSESMSKQAQDLRSVIG